MSFVVSSGLGRALANSWNELVHRSDPLARPPQPDLSSRDETHVRAAMLACATGRAGEPSAHARAAALGRTYLALDEKGKARFVGVLAEFDADRRAIEQAIDRVRSADGPDAFGAAAQDLRMRLAPPWLNVLRCFNELPDGTKFLVDLRADLLAVAQPTPVVRRLERDLRELLVSWFDIGFLELRRITWEASAQLLEKLARYEAVHEVRSWLDLKDRLDADRRCYAYLHPAMPGEPLVFVEVALVTEMADRIAPLLDATAPRGDPRDATTAIFYSISNCQRGLAGISLGSALIKGVVEALSGDFPRLRQFATLSPIPGFRAWLSARPPDDGALSAALAEALAKRTWYRDANVAQSLRRPLMRLCSSYLLDEKAADGGPKDPVERFHLGNGARLERLNWLADTSPKGMRESAGMMVNYVYRAEEIDTNREAYAVPGKIVASKAVRDLRSAR